MRGKLVLLPCDQTCALLLRNGVALASVSASSLATMISLGWTMSMQWASEGPTRLVLSSETTPPMRVMPIQTAMYSGRFSIKRQTVSPLAMPCERAQRA